MTRTLLHGGVDADGERLDVLVDAETGRIAAVGPALDHDAERVDCTGSVVLPAPAEPHAHLDKALSARVAPNPAGDLLGAIDAWHAHWPNLTEEEVLGRARRAAHELVAHGTTAIRSHADVSPELGTTSVRALVTLREELARQGLAELQVVALCAPPDGSPSGRAAIARAAGARGPQAGGAAGHGTREALAHAALDAGADVVGGCPHLDPDPVAGTRAAFAVAAERGRPIDLHTDETLDPAMLALPELIRLVAEAGFPHGAVGSHCVSLGMQAPEVQADVARAAAAAPVAIVACPLTNLYLQARGRRMAPPRGLTAIRALLDAGATVAAGADNVRDPFNAMGRSDALETAALLVMAAHLTPAEAYDRVSAAARQAMGLPVVTLTPGAPAELLAVRGADLPDAIARACEHRITVHRGRVVARTHVQTELSCVQPALT